MTEDEIARALLAQYDAQGFAGPFRAFEARKMEALAPVLMAEFDAKHHALMATRNRHLDWEPVRALALSPQLLWAARVVLGEPLTLWRSQCFVARAGHGLGWHRDEYDGLLSDPLRHCSLHLAITGSMPDNCLMIAPGSHRVPREELGKHGFHFSGKTGYGTSTFWRQPEGRPPVTQLLLQPGEFFIFHPYLLHASFDKTAPDAKPSGPAPKSPPRIGLAVRLAPPSTQIFDVAFVETAARGDRAIVV